MSKKDDALKLALEALEVASSCVDGYYIPIGKSHLPEVEQAITAIREALAAPQPSKPLTFDEQEMLRLCPHFGPSPARDQWIAGYEAAHGITGEK